ncbi:MAG TPA: hypothetical protein VEB68_14335 [Croceibacterium sp.]|nr:hypothetical protein [Croceibacterium sp.]
MPDRTPALPAFTPVPRAKDRSNGWKPEVQRAFIEALAETGSVRAACRRVGRSDRGAYQLLHHPEAAGFRAAWDAALAFGVRRIEDGAMDRALYGVEEQVFYHGELRAVRRRFNERLVMFMLRNRAPDRFGEGKSKGLSALDKATLRKREKEWRAAWEEEQRRLDDERRQRTHAKIDAWLGTMHRNRLATMSPAQRERQIAADAQARADKAAGWSPGLPYGEFAADAAALLPRFVAEVEAQWPPLEPWAWEEPDDADHAADSAPAPRPGEPAALPAPAAAEPERPAEPGGPRVRTLKDDGW